MKKTTWHLGLALLCALSAVSWANPLVRGSDKLQELIIYDEAQTQSPTLAEQARLVWQKRLDTIDPKEFSAKAQLDWLTQQRPIVDDAQSFIFPASFPQTQQGWTGMDGQYIWRAQSARYAPLSLSLTAVDAEQPFQWADYDEFWVDYTPILGIEPCVPQLKLQGHVQPYNKKYPTKTVGWRTSKAGGKVLLALNASNTTLKMKDYSYLLGRIFGLVPDEDWRFVQDYKKQQLAPESDGRIAQDQKITVIQRRMHLKLDSVRFLDIALANGVGAERVNLMVSRKDSHGGGELVEFAGLPPNSILPDGRSGVRLDLGGALARHFSRDEQENTKERGANSLYLQEVILFLPGDVQSVVATKPVRSIELQEQAVDDGYEQNVQPLTSQALRVNTFQQRMSVDIRKLRTSGHVGMTQASLSLLPSRGAASCALHINGVRAVRIHDDKVPVFASNLEEWVRNRGGPFARMLPKQGQVEQPGIVNFLPLSTLSLTESEKMPIRQYLPDSHRDNQSKLNPISTNGPVPAFRLLSSDGKTFDLGMTRLISNSGAALAFQGAMPVVSHEGEWLVLSGYSDSLEIAWPLSVKFPENFWFYFGMAGGADQIGYLMLTAEFANGQQASYPVAPNQPIRIDTAGRQTTALKLSIVPIAKPFRLELRDLAVFSPKVVNYGEARIISLPTAIGAKPKPSPMEGSVGLVDMGPGKAVGLLGNEPVRFLTLLDKPLDWVRGLRLDFRLPLGSVDEGQCPLMLQLNWAKGQTRRQICTANMEGSIFVPLANLLGAEMQGRNLGALESIEWMVASSGSSAREMQKTFSLSFVVEGWAMASAMDQLGLSPLFQAGRDDMYADISKVENARIGAYSKRFWLPLEAGGLGKMAAMDGEILPVRHPLITLNKIVAEPRQPISRARWEALFASPLSGAPPRWPKWLAWVSGILLAWATWKKGLWSPGGLGRVFLGTGGILIGLTRITIRRLGTMLWRLLPWLNLLVGILALVPGLWLSGYLGASFQGGMLLIGLVLVLWGAYSHWRKNSSHRWQEGGGVVLTLSIGCAVWSLGHFGLQLNATWGLLPLMGALYVLLPQLYCCAQGSRHLLALFAWATLVLVLYGMGLTMQLKSGENYFFTFGGMAAVLLLREAILVIKPRFRRSFPHIANHVYGGAGNLYFSSALALLVILAVMLSLKLGQIAEQLAVVVYYCLVVGTVLEIVALRHANDEQTGDKSQMQSHTTA